MSQKERDAFRPIDWRETASGCWECTSHSPSLRYPRFYRDGGPVPIHRFMYEQCFGEIPEGMLIRHKCNNTRCINPEHLAVGTYFENTADRRGNGTWPSGENNAFHKLTEVEVREIKKLLSVGKMSKAAIGRMFHVDRTTVSYISAGKLWRHVA